MKPFDKAAAMRGARVCTRDGREARILCFDLENDHHICAAIKLFCGEELINCYTDEGYMNPDYCDESDLMMADDDYKEKLARGEYDTHATSAAPAPDTAHVPDPVPATYIDPWDEFKRQAALELIRIMGAPIGSRYVTDIVEKVNGIADGLKSK